MSWYESYRDDERSLIPSLANQARADGLRNRFGLRITEESYQPIVPRPEGTKLGSRERPHGCTHARHGEKRPVAQRFRSRRGQAIPIERIR